MEDMAAHALATTLDPGDPTMLSSAKSLAERIVGDSPAETAVRRMLDDVAHGARVVVLRAEDEVTPAQAAEILGVTRQFVDRLCEDGVLPFHRLPASRYRRIRVQDVLDVAAEREQLRAGGAAIRAALGE
ncbi:MAG: helix-turn-helix domain-containing protein [Cellulomonas sp.]|jgi:excisionase family DNA binding protein|nr:helix-turn-helix domain-containing protein [Cellulomonas sp.]